MILRELLYFQKSDRKILLFLLLVAVVAMLLFFGIGNGSGGSDVAVIDSSRVATEQYKPTYTYRYERREPLPQRSKGELFYFDPNTVDSASLARLGFSERQIANLYKYRAAGAVFQTPQDFARLWGLTKGQYDRLRPYIRISDDFLPASSFYETPPPREPRDTSHYVAKVQPGVKVPVNASDTTALKTVPGIGSYFAQRIVSYRNRLGGYVSTSQLKEIDNFPESALDYLVLDEEPTKKLNLNKLSVSKLSAHPYINFFQARAIVDFRRLKRPLASLNDLQLLKEFSPSDIDRLAPYVEF